MSKAWVRDGITVKVWCSGGTDKQLGRRGWWRRKDKVESKDDRKISCSWNNVLVLWMPFLPQQPQQWAVEIQCHQEVKLHCDEGNKCSVSALRLLLFQFVSSSVHWHLGQSPLSDQSRLTMTDSSPPSPFDNHPLEKRKQNQHLPNDLKRWTWWNTPEARKVWCKPASHPQAATLHYLVQAFPAKKSFPARFLFPLFSLVFHSFQTRLGSAPSTHHKASHVWWHLAARRSSFPSAPVLQCNQWEITLSNQFSVGDAHWKAGFEHEAWIVYLAVL